MEQQVTTQHMPGYLAPLYTAKGWMKFVGIMMIINGAFMVLSIWGIVIAWLPIWVGIILVSASNLLEQGGRTNNEQMLHEAFEKMGKYFKLSGILFIVMLVLGVIGIIAAITIPAIIGMQQMSGM